MKEELKLRKAEEVYNHILKNDKTTSNAVFAKTFLWPFGLSFNGFVSHR